ncbi:VacJ family lipoprotein [Luteolibacter pohnpeiensis]|uniref:VacJ family lipoprotein n=1 Tax=Luteolibacter pohnpeiensis TaxID=454153 RepID=A0A934S4W5_9BACT|nr:VacJ family lipoprotein [Luteolibacter pohnpeiensis]MBK1880801.1 VacJ family lipoprotein [Luteolibacter pohnpeiensis]
MNFPAARSSASQVLDLTPTAKRISWCALFATLSACAPTATDHSGADSSIAKLEPGVRHIENFPEFLPDPAEPLNRAIWGINKGLVTGIVNPTARGYRKVVPARARESVADFSRNITYPGRLANNLLQGRWKGAGEESLRFLTNTTVGIGGLFDPATKWGIPESDASFGQTFSRWGWEPNLFVMVPLLGPSDDSHATGAVGDELANPLNYTDYRYLTYGTYYNELSGKSESAAQFIQTESDSYSGTKYLWTYGAKESQPDWSASPERDLPTLQTLNAATIRPKDPDFLEHGRQMSVRLTSTGKNFKFNCWLQPTNAPLVYVSPGLGSHRISNMTLALAECIYQQGYSVVTLTGVYHPEFMEQASTVAMPAYPPIDEHDLMVAITDIDQKLTRKYPDRFGKRVLVGFSMGAFQALHIAARESSEEPRLLRFDRYVALNPPVNLQHGAAVIASYQEAPLEWPAAERQERINNAAHKAVKVIGLPPEKLANPPFDATESKFLIGMSFSLTLRDTIYTSQMRHNMHVLQSPLSRWRRDAVYSEILNYSFHDYYERFVIPYYQELGIGRKDFDREVDLRTYESRLHRLKNVRVITNRNDFLLNADDISWLRSTFDPSRLTLFANGGHLGSLGTPEVQNELIKALQGLK